MIDTAPSPDYAELRRFSIRLTRPLWIGLVIAVYSVQAAVAGDPAADEIEKETQSAQQLRIADQTVLNWVFGRNDLDAGAVRTHLDALLRRKFAIVDRVCALTYAQNQKLQLAGRGEIKRLLDHLEDIGRRFQLVKDDPDKVKALFQDAQQIRRGLTSGLSDADSLFVKVLETTLTGEQAAGYRLLRDVSRSGGYVQTRQHGTDQLLEIILTATSFADNDLARLSDFPDLQILRLDQTRVTDTGISHLKGLPSLTELDLSVTQVTDSGLAHLKGMTKLKRLILNNPKVTDAGIQHLSGLPSLEMLSLANTQVTDAGLAHLKGLTSLGELRLHGTHVTDAGVADLKRVLPGLKVER